ncbi:MAG: TIM barrel protein [Acidobacteria bacterium]|nr:TIM barrel protein [Acidobacteriota bacterium]
MPRMAIMQGRLVPPEGKSIQSFPRDRWRDEFERAAAAGLDAIEWIDDVHGADVNPLATDAGVAEMEALSRRTNVSVVSVCADYFLDRPLVRVDEDTASSLVARLVWLIDRCAVAGISRVVLPFVDASRIETPADERRVLDVLARVLPFCERSGLELHLETSLAPRAFASLLAHVPHPLVFANYDSGNSASLGYDVGSELAAYGSRVGSVHVKDRVRGGGTVPLGTGSADLPALFDGLAAVGYAGDFVLQVARGAAGGEVEWARQNRAFVMRERERARAAASRPAC